MFGLTKLWNAVAALAASLTNLASTVDAVNKGLREHVGLDTPDATAQLSEPAEAAVASRRRTRAAE